MEHAIGAVTSYENECNEQANIAIDLTQHRNGSRREWSIDRSSGGRKGGTKVAGFLRSRDFDQKYDFAHRSFAQTRDQVT